MDKNYIMNMKIKKVTQYIGHSVFSIFLTNYVRIFKFWPSYIQNKETKIGNSLRYLITAKKTWNNLCYLI